MTVFQYLFDKIFKTYHTNFHKELAGRYKSQSNYNESHRVKYKKYIRKFYCAYVDMKQS